MTRWFVENDNLEEFEIFITANYWGNKYGGPVDIVTEPKIDLENETKGWDDFRNDFSESRSIKLKPYELYYLADIPSDIPSLNLDVDSPHDEIKTEGEFDIIIEAPGYGELERITIKVINTTWFHSTQLSDSAILEGEKVIVYVTVKNLGAPSEFKVNYVLYKATEVDADSLTMNPYKEYKKYWWPLKTWKNAGESPEGESVEVSDYVITEIIDRNNEYTVKFEIPGENTTNFKFESKNIYILETDARKNLPYVKFPNGESWTVGSKENWRLRDQAQFSTIVVID